MKREMRLLTNQPIEDLHNIVMAIDRSGLDMSVDHATPPKTAFEVLTGMPPQRSAKGFIAVMTNEPEGSEHTAFWNLLSAVTSQ